MHGLFQDLRHALRGSLRHPVLPLVAVLSVAVGVGVNAAVFTLVDSLFLQDLPGVRDPDRIVEIGRSERPGDWGSFAYPDFVDLREQARVFDAVAAVDIQPMSLSDEASGERVLSFQVTSGYFDVMGVRPLLGRTFAPEEDVGPGEHPVAILSYRTWQRRFGGDPGVLGRTVRLDREPYTVVGVAPATFKGHLFGLQPEVYVPLMQSEAARRNEMYWEYRGTIWLEVFGRLRSGATLEGAQAELTTIFARLADVYPETNAHRSALVAMARPIPPEGRTPLAAGALVIGALLLLVLAATCANVAALFLSKAAARERDIAVRVALGSGRGRLVRHLVSEALVIFTLGGAGGIVVAAWAVRILDPNRLLPVPFPVTLDLAVGWHALAFGGVLTLGTAVVFGVLPALRVSGTDVSRLLRAGASGAGLGSGRLRRAFVTGQVGVSILLLAIGALFLRSLQSVSDVEVGFDPEGVYVTSFDLSLEGYRTRSEAMAFVEEVLGRATAIPGVTGATVATDLPLDGASSGQTVLPEGAEPGPGASVQAYYASVTPGFFDALKISRLRGRVFGSRDGPTTPRVAVVNRTLAERFWPGEDPVGRRIQYGLDQAWHTVIGVVQDTKADMITDNAAPQVYGLLSQEYQPDVRLALRAARPGAEVPPMVDVALRSVDPSLAMDPVRPLSSFAGLGTLPHRVGAVAATVLGTLALLLSAMGIYGVVAFSVAQRTREIGVRMALGAARGRILGMVVMEGLLLALPGLAVGAALAAGVGRLLGAFLLGVSPVDPLAFCAVGAVLAALVVAASFIPARRASAVAPAEALRYD